MPSHSTGGSNQPVVLSPRMKLRLGSQWQGSAELAPPPSAVLGNEEGSFEATAPLSMFTPAEQAIELDVHASPDAVLGAEEPQSGQLEYQPAEPAVYALLQAIQTSEGTIYDFTLPQPAPGEGGLVLGPDENSGKLHFPVNPIALDLDTPGQGSQGAVLGIEDVIGGAVAGVGGGIILKRVLQVIKSPIEKSLIDAFRHSEGEPWAGVLRNGEFQPIQGAEAWRSVAAPGSEKRVLLLVHGFASSINDGSKDWLAKLGQGYDAVLGFNHPTVWCDPEQNANMLLDMIPDDLRLSVDIIAHSRGGLVARSLVELVEPRDSFNVRRIITNGTPHAGTRLADPERWDRLVSIGMTAASWLASATGALVWVPKVLELVLKAASQIAFDLPGIGAMTPSGAFIQKINAGADSGSRIAAAQSNVRYTTITSRYSVFGTAHPAFQQAMNAFAAQAFFDTPNDLVVPTESMSAIDQLGLVPKERQLLAGLDHFSYFRDSQVLDFIARQLAD